MHKKHQTPYTTPKPLDPTAALCKSHKHKHKPRKSTRHAAKNSPNRIKYPKPRHANHMGNVMVAPPKTELQRMRQVESQLTRQQNRIKSIARSENNRLARLQTKLANNMNKKRDCVNTLENQQISHEMAFIVHNQKSLTECFEHLAVFDNFAS